MDYVFTTRDARSQKAGKKLFNKEQYPHKDNIDAIKDFIDNAMCVEDQSESLDRKIDEESKKQQQTSRELGLRLLRAQIELGRAQLELGALYRWVLGMSIYLGHRDFLLSHLDIAWWYPSCQASDFEGYDAELNYWRGNVKYCKDPKTGEYRRSVPGVDTWEK